MHSTRREFFRKAASIGYCALFPLAGIAQSRKIHAGPYPAREGPDQLVGLTAETFEAWVGSQFRAVLNRKSAGTLTLVSVTTLDPKLEIPSAAKAARSPAITGFALQFSKAGAPLLQETYTLEHDWLGTFPLLLVPSGAHTTPATCTAVFTLLR